MSEIQVRPQEEMADPQDMKVFAVERHGLPEDFAYFRALRGVQSSPLVFAPNRAIVWSPLQWQTPVETLSIIVNPSPHGRFHYAHRPKRLSVRGGRSRTAIESVRGLDVDQSLSQLTKCILLTPHKAPELTKLQPASYVGVR